MAPHGDKEPKPFSRGDAAFAAPDGAEWMRVSPVLRHYRRIVLCSGLVPAAAVGALLLTRWGGTLEIALWLIAAAAAAVSGWFLADLSQRALGYAEGETDFHLVHGVLVRQLVVIPYGRMQLVDVTANLLERALGLATVRVRTASPSGEADVAGLTAEEAARLRDRLVARSESFPTGL
jgi:uncharacterized protein